MPRIDPERVRRFAVRAAAASAKLEGRELPEGYIRSAAVEEFLKNTAARKL